MSQEVKIETPEEMLRAFYQAYEDRSIMLGRHEAILAAVRVRDSLIRDALIARADQLVKAAELTPDTHTGSHLYSQAQALRDFVAKIPPAAREVPSATQVRETEIANCKRSALEAAKSGTDFKVVLEHLNITVEGLDLSDEREGVALKILASALEAEVPYLRILEAFSLEKMPGVLAL